jgi:predicted nuclease with RNAse H fold
VRQCGTPTCSLARATFRTPEAEVAGTSGLWRPALQIAHEVSERHAKCVRDQFGGGDAGREPPGLKLSEVLGVHGRCLALAAGHGGDLRRYVLKRPLLGLSLLAHGLAEGEGGWIGVGASAWHARKETGNRSQNELDMSRVGALLVAGIDLSGRTTGTTALALLAGTASGGRPCLEQPVVTKGLRGAKGDERIVGLLVDARPDVVAIDAPLHLPHAVRCRDEGCPRCFASGGVYSSYTTRMLERKERWEGPTTRAPMPMVMVAGIAFRAIFLRRLLEREGIRVIETWPAGVFRQMQGAPGRSSRLDAATRARLLLGGVDDPGRRLQQPDLSLDVADAVAAALAAYAFATNAFRSIGDDAWADEGAIVLPCVTQSALT